MTPRKEILKKETFSIAVLKYKSIWSSLKLCKERSISPQQTCAQEGTD